MVEGLVEAGVDVVFGIPSIHNLPIYDAIRRDGRIRAVTVRHEQGASGAADGYARTTGRLGVCLTSTGPGATNAMGGQLEAYTSSTPMLHLTGQIQSQYLGQSRGFIHEVPDQFSMLASLSKTAFRVASADDISDILATAIEEAITFPQGPVSLEIPIDFQYARVPYGATRMVHRSTAPVGPHDADVAKAVGLILESRRPIIWAGGGAIAAGASDEVAALVRRLGAGLLTSPNGRGVLSEDDPSCLGNLPWDPDVRALCQEADLLVAIGTRFQGQNTDNWRMELPARLVQLDVNPSVPGRNYPVASAIVGDAKLSIAALLDGLDRAGATNVLAEPVWHERVVAVARSSKKRARKALGVQVGLLDGLAACVRPSTVVVKDSTIPAYTWGNRLLPVRRPRTSIMPNSFAIGLGLPQAVGAAVGSGEPVVLLAGDGGFLLAATELATVAQERLPIVAIVFVDGSYGVLRNIQDHLYGSERGRIGVDLGQADYCSLASAFGIESVHVNSLESYAAAVRGALDAEQSCLIEVDLNAIGLMPEPYRGLSSPPVSNE